MNPLSHLPEEKQKEILIKNPFEPRSNTLPNHVVASIERGMEETEQGKIVDLKTFKKKHYLNRLY